MPPIDEPVSSEPKSPAPGGRRSKTSSAASEPAPSADLVAFTVDAANGRIIKVEGSVDAAGAHRELSKDEHARLVETAAKATLERVVEQAFEAGIDCALGADAGEEETAKSDGDAESRLLLRSLMERSGPRRLMRREVLGRAIVGTLIEQAAAFRTSTSEGAATH